MTPVYSKPVWSKLLSERLLKWIVEYAKSVARNDMMKPYVDCVQNPNRMKQQTSTTSEIMDMKHFGHSDTQNKLCNCLVAVAVEAVVSIVVT